MPFDMDHALEHPDAAGCVLGALDPDDAASFEEHLGLVFRLQAVVADSRLSPMLSTMRRPPSSRHRTSRPRR